VTSELDSKKYLDEFIREITMITECSDEELDQFIQFLFNNSSNNPKDSSKN